MRRRAWRRTSLSTVALLLLGALGVAEHQAESPPPYAVGEQISEVGHSGRDLSLHVDAASVKPPHTCVVCWLGSAGLGVPTQPAAPQRPSWTAIAVAPASSPALAARGAPSSRGPPAI